MARGTLSKDNNWLLGPSGPALDVVRPSAVTFSNVLATACATSDVVTLSGKLCGWLPRQVGGLGCAPGLVYTPASCRLCFTDVATASLMAAMVAGCSIVLGGAPTAPGVSSLTSAGTPSPSTHPAPVALFRFLLLRSACLVDFHLGSILTDWQSTHNSNLYFTGERR